MRRSGEVRIVESGLEVALGIARDLLAMVASAGLMVIIVTWLGGM